MSGQHKCKAGYGTWLAIGLVLVMFSAQPSAAAVDATTWSVEQSCERLKLGGPDERAAAARRLGELKAAGAVEALRASLTDQDGPTRQQSAWALGEMRDAQALTTFFEVTFWDPDPAVRAAAARAVGKIKDTTPIKPLLVGGHGTPGGAAPQEPASVKRYQSTRPLAYLLHDGDPVVRAEAAWALGEVQDGWALEDLIAVMADASAAVRQASCTALGKLRDRRALPALERAAADTDAATKAAAQEAIGALTAVAGQ